MPNSPLVGSLTFRSGTGTPLTTTKTYDKLDRLTSINNQSGVGSAISFQYAYNDANQRIQVNEADGSHWKYEYDTLGQVISGKKYWSDQTPVAGQQFEYAFDDIGNRKSTKAGGDQNGGGLRTSAYSPNLINQYSGRTVPNVADVIGVANANASVTVNGATTSRKGEYFAGTVSVNNTTGAVYRGITNVATLGGNTVNTNGNLFFASTNEIFTYDADGNLKTDGRWNYTWDGENRLIAMDAVSGIPTGAMRKLSFAYDSIGRRVRKAVQTWNGSSWPITLSNRFVYDGWNLIGELNATNNTAIRRYAWGLDLSNTMRGAGGVGGLLALAAANGTNVIGYGGNGDVEALVDSTSANVTARYVYGPFGELRASEGSASDQPFQFSSRFYDQETDLNNFGVRYYDPRTGAWLTRDRVDELGGLNLYGFTANAAINAVDPLGYSSKAFTTPAGTAFDLYGAWWDGTTSDNVDFRDGDPMAEELKRTREVTDAISIFYQHLQFQPCGKTIPPVRVSRSLRSESSLMYPFDFARDLIYNPTRAFLGSFDGQASLLYVDCCKGRAVVGVHIWDRPRLGSASHLPPMFGTYIEALKDVEGPAGTPRRSFNVDFKISMTLSIIPMAGRVSCRCEYFFIPPWAPMLAN